MVNARVIFWNVLRYGECKGDFRALASVMVDARVTLGKWLA